MPPGFGELVTERGRSRLWRAEDVGVTLRWAEGVRLREEARGVAIVDMVDGWIALVGGLTAKKEYRVGVVTRFVCGELLILFWNFLDNRHLLHRHGKSLGKGLPPEMVVKAVWLRVERW